MVSMLRIFEMFRYSTPELLRYIFMRCVFLNNLLNNHYSGKFSMRFEEMPQSILSNTEVYALFASYLTREYKQEGGRNSGIFLACDSVLGYFGSIVYAYHPTQIQIP